MDKVESSSNRSGAPAPSTFSMKGDPTPPLFPLPGSEAFQELSEMVGELLKEMQQENLDWLDRRRKEFGIASEYMGKMTAPGGPENMAKVMQEWAGRRMEFIAEDATHLWAGPQKWMGILRAHMQPAKAMPNGQVARV